MRHPSHHLSPGWALLYSQIKVLNPTVPKDQKMLKITTLYWCTGRLFRACFQTGPFAIFILLVFLVGRGGLVSWLLFFFCCFVFVLLTSPVLAKTLCVFFVSVWLGEGFGIFSAILNSLVKIQLMEISCFDRVQMNLCKMITFSEKLSLKDVG